ncbi:MAG: kelch repeat-containing protein, partial [Elusimicrobiota bacterium]
MKRSIVIAAVITLFLSINSYAFVAAQWKVLPGTDATDTYYEMCADDNGIYITGSTYGSFPGNTNEGIYDDAFLLKYDRYGSLVWARQFYFGGDWNDRGNSVATDSSGNIFVSGSLFQYQYRFMRKYDTNGNMLWQTLTATGNCPTIEATAVNNSSGVVYITYNVYNTHDYDVVVDKYDANTGNFISSLTAGTTGYDYVKDLKIDSSGNVYLLGYTDSSFTGQQALGNGDAFVRKYDIDGNILWTLQCGTTHYEDIPYSIVIDSVTNALISCNSGNSADAYIIKIASSGTNVLWNRGYGSSREGGKMWRDDAVGALYIAALSKLDSEAVQDWDTRVNGSSDNDYDIDLAWGGMYLAGQYWGTDKNVELYQYAWPDLTKINNFSGYETGLQKVSLQWTSPSSATIRKYEIKYTENASNDYWSSPYTLTWSTSTSNGVVETKLITGLTGGSTYYFRIRATDNSTGWNECSAQYGGICIPRDTTPPTGTPGTPVDTGMYSTSTLITFEWSIGTIEDTDTAISDYYLQVATAATDCESYIYGTSEGLNTSDVIGNIVTGTTYYARVKAANIDGYYSNWSSWSNGILIDTITPSAVGTVRDGTGVDIVFTNNFDRLSGNWDEATDEGSGIAGYYCAIGTTSGGTDILAWTSTGTSRDFTKTGLTLVYNTTYYFSVKCIDNVGFYSGVTTSNGQVVIDVSAPVGVPSAPADTGTISTTTALSFVWGFGLCIDPESGVSGYHLQVSTADSECEEHLFDSYVGNTESYTVTGGVTGITYYARVKGRNGQYLYSNYSVWNDGILVDTVTPSAVSIVKDSTGTDIAVTNNFDTLSANWSAATDEGSGIAGYYYAMGTNSGGTNIVDWTSVGTSVNVTKTGLSLMYNTTYYVSVKAVDNAGLYSNVTTSNGQVVIDSSTPQGLASTPIDAGAYSTMTALTFTWSAGTLVDIESGISGYYLQVSTAATEASAFLYDAYIGNVLTQEVTGAVTGKTYYVRIKARNGQSLYGSYTTWSDGILVDTTPPVFSYIYDGTDTDSEYNMSSTTLAANWKFIDTETSITTNYYCIGTTSGGTDIIGWTSVETDTYTVKTGLTLVQDTTYYFSVKARNAAGLSTEVYSSTGIVLPKPTGSATRVYPSKFTSSQTSYDITWTAGTLTDITGINGYWLQVATAPYDCISYLIDNYIGNYTTWTITGCQDKKTYYARIKGKNNVSVYGQWNAWSEGTSIDLTAPSAPAAVRDGLGSGTSITSSSHTLSANWDIAIDNDSGISRYRYAIGSTPGGADLKNWTEATLWANITQTTRPSARYVYGMAADAVSNKIVVYGGWNGGVLSDTWEYDINLNIWVNKNPSSVPSGQRGVKLVYDTENKKFVTFGGYNGTAQLQDTYVYDDVQNSWTNMNPSTKPSIREYYSMVYDSYNEKTLLFGGWEGVNRYNDTWAYDYAVNTWTGLNPGGSLPPVRYGQSMVYDSNNRQVILFGGSGDSGYLDDTWIYNYGNNTWTQKFPINKPSARYEHSMVYDPVNKRVLLFGGYGSSGYLKDTWYYDVSGNQWYELNPSSSPQQRYGAGMVYDRTTKTSFLLGGYQLGYLDDVQVFKPGTSVSQSGLSLIENSTYYYSVYYENGAGAYGTIASDGQYYNSAYVPPVTPVISSMTTTSGYEDDIITIYGTSFLALQGTSYVKFYNNQVSSITLWSDTIITCKVPPSAETGSVTVNTSGGESNGINFTILYSTYGVSGYVKDNSSNVLVGIQVTLSGDSSGSTYTDATGYFFVYVSTNSYTITPSSTNWSFSPSSRNYSTLISSQTGQNFYGTYTGPVYYKVCGYVLDNSSSALTGMTVSLSGEISGTTLTDGNGYYELTVTTNSFVVTVSSNNWRFLPVNRSYSLLSSTQTSQNVFGTYNYAPILEWAGEAGYTDDGLNYDSGTSTTAFVYRVKYTDQDNDAPVNGYPKLYIKRNGVNISGSPFVLTYVSGNNNTGAVYSSTNSLLPSSGYTYYFAAYDIWGATATGTPLTPVARPVVTNIIPELSWSGETGYTTDGINYETGVSSTLYTYRIKFMDLDNESPAAGYPKLYIKKNGVNISGSPFTMAYFSGNYNTGAIYFYHASLTPGNDYTYYFEAYDLSYATATGMPAASKDAPDVINNSPSISWTSEAGYTSDGLNPEDGATSTQFVYRVKYTDPDNDAPATGYPKLYLKTNGVNIPGSPFTMTMITGNYTL